MGRLFPIVYDHLMKPLEQGRFTKIRKDILKNASGHVVEIGAGSGINFPYYRKAADVTAIEPSMDMWKRANKRNVEHSIPISLHEESAEKLPFADSTFDTAVATLVFCTIPDPLAAIREIQRVTKPGATILIFEHIKMEQPALAKAQTLLTPAWKKVCDGCRLDRDPLGMFKQYDFSIERTDYYYKGLFMAAKLTNTKSDPHT